MSVAPGFDIAADVDGVPCRPGLAVEIGNLFALCGLMHVACSVEVGEAGDSSAGFDCIGAESCKQVLHSELAFAEDDVLRACLKVLEGVGSWFGTADDGLPASFAGYLENLDYVAARHQIGVDANGGWSLSAQMLKQGFAAGEGGVEDIDIEALFSKMRAQIENAKRRIRLQNLKLFRVLVEEVAMSEKKIH